MTAVASSLGLEWKGQVSVTNSRITRSPRDLKSNMARRTPLTAEVRQQCIDEGRCFNCREMGHSICECPKTTGGTIGDHPDQLNFMGNQAYRQPWGSDSSDSELDEAFENEWLGGSEKEEEDEEEKK
ncbi:hypothetical protein MVLG_06672 [Microbotryum lychnidis-dioicae p1A1 Lamole]|uniref:CCHC-type domain-containing protein n=1 Tax=Microbotryum lychnidis-dioicae (strain p1A1 Lamole / MvSl-1064) TaxID=683840 RepID=U5HI03_USTV1|nr:hypothetical protein MVLG_06672 [Microbotryum lychnidis-dioicae p1A1 Lamole]|eukprot:KDE02814.1 hypothetical protein MVLG_06672 [Microbotryum lychnidis-dioicae p1A1 Lamole]